MRELRIGRSRENDIVIDDPTVSKNHGALVIVNDRVSIRDNNSLNGTFINGKRIRGEVNLNHNDIVKVGNSVLPWRNYLSQNASSNNQNSYGSQNSYNSSGSGHKPVYTVKKNNTNLILIFVGIVIFLFALVFFLRNGSPESKLLGKWECVQGCNGLKEITFEMDGEVKNFRWKDRDNRISKGKWKIKKSNSSTKELTLRFIENDSYNSDQVEWLFEYRQEKDELELTEISTNKDYEYDSGYTILLEKSR